MRTAHAQRNQGTFQELQKIKSTLENTRNQGEMRKHIRWVRNKRAILRERVGQVCCREGQTISQGWLHIFYRADTRRAGDIGSPSFLLPP